MIYRIDLFVTSGSLFSYAFSISFALRSSLSLRSFIFVKQSNGIVCVATVFVYKYWTNNSKHFENKFESLLIFGEEFLVSFFLAKTPFVSMLLCIVFLNRYGAPTHFIIAIITIEHVIDYYLTLQKNHTSANIDINIVLIFVYCVWCAQGMSSIRKEEKKTIQVNIDSTSIDGIILNIVLCTFIRELDSKHTTIWAEPQTNLFIVIIDDIIFQMKKNKMRKILKKSYWKRKKNGW